jgi:hypothetical protein
MPPQEFQQQPVAFLGKIVPPLVGQVDQTFDTGQVVVCRLRSTGHVFQMPQFKVGQVLRGDDALESGQGVRDRWRLPVPVRGALIMEGGDVMGTER